MNIQIKPQ